MKCLIFFFFFCITHYVVGQELKKFILKSESGQIRKEFSAYDDSATTKHGSYQYFYKDVLLFKGQYINGLKEGAWTYYNMKGEVILRAVYKEDIKVGNWKYYYGKDTLASVIPYSNGKINGRCLGYAKNGTLTFDIQYVNGIKEGLAATYYINGNKKNVYYYSDGLRQGDGYKYFPDGNLHRQVYYRNNNPCNNIIIYNLNNDTIDGGTLLDGNGSFISYNYECLKDDSFYINGKESYRYHKLHGKQEQYFYNGAVKELKKYNDGWLSDSIIRYNLSGKAFSIVGNNTTKNKKTYYGDNFFLEIGNEFSATYLAKFIDGESGLMNFLKTEIIYPEYVRQNNIEGKAVIRFTIDVLGNITDINILSSSGNNLLDAEALRTIKSMPNWIPSYIDGVPVNIYFNLPLMFRLD